MSKFFRKLIFCGCSSRTGGLDGRSIVVDESIVDDPPKFAGYSSYEAEPEDLARHFDLSTIKFIDDEEADEDASCAKNGSRLRSIGFSFFFFFIEKWVDTDAVDPASYSPLRGLGI